MQKDYASCEACNPRTGEILLTEDERYALNNGLCMTCIRDEEECRCDVDLFSNPDEIKPEETTLCCNKHVLKCMCDVPF